MFSSAQPTYDVLPPDSKVYEGRGALADHLACGINRSPAEKSNGAPGESSTQPLLGALNEPSQRPRLWAEQSTPRTPISVIQQLSAKRGPQWLDHQIYPEPDARL